MIASPKKNQKNDMTNITSGQRFFTPSPPARRYMGSLQWPSLIATSLYN